VGGGIIKSRKRKERSAESGLDLAVTPLTEPYGSVFVFV
jgi:hypothetical protein